MSEANTFSERLTVEFKAIQQNMMWNAVMDGFPQTDEEKEKLYVKSLRELQDKNALAAALLKSKHQND